MKERIEELFQEIDAFDPQSPEEVEEFRIRFLGKKGVMNELFASFKEVSPEEKKELGKKLNELKQKAQEKVNALKEQTGDQRKGKHDSVDTSMPAGETPVGSRHPVTLVRDEIIDILQRIGFTVAEGPEIEDDWHNFTALNMPEDHPARDMQDTFFIERDPDMVLRTHTSNVQIRQLEKYDPPMRIIAPGRVYRCDNDATHSPAFHQVEGMYIDERVSFADLKQTLYYFVREMFGEGVDVRFRPSFFPFTEPSAEMDISFEQEGKTKWMEILGCGMVDPNVLKNCNVDTDRFTGFAFGIGIERIAMLKYGIHDLRMFFENDVRFLDQFKAAY